MTSLGDLVAQQLNQSLDQLNVIWKEIGLSDDEKQDKLQCIFESVQSSIRQIVLEADQQRQGYLSEIKKIQIRVGDAQRALRLADTISTMKLGHLPLREQVNSLKKDTQQYEKLYTERCEIIKKLVDQKRNIQKLLYVEEHSLVEDDLSDLSKEFIAALQAEVKQLEDQKSQREKLAADHIQHIDRLLSDLAAAPEARYQLSDKASLLFEETLQLLDTTRKELEAEKQKRRTQLEQFRSKVQQLWTRLDIKSSESDSFLLKHPLHLLSIENLRAYERELHRLNDLKSASLVKFIQKTREELQQLWHRMGYSEEQCRKEAPFAFVKDTKETMFTEDLLHLHESEVERLLTILKVLEPILVKIEQLQSTLRDIEEFEIQSKDPERLFKRDPGRLLREEKFRKIISHKLPQLEKSLREDILAFEATQLKGQPFYYQNRRYLDYLNTLDRERRMPTGKDSSNTNNNKKVNLVAINGVSAVLSTPVVQSTKEKEVSIVNEISKHEENDMNMANNVIPTLPPVFTYTSSLVATALADGKKTSLPLPLKMTSSTNQSHHNLDSTIV